MLGMGLSTQQICVNVRVGSFAAYLIRADAPVCLLFLQPVGRSPMSALGQTLPKWTVSATSAFLPTAEIGRLHPISFSRNLASCGCRNSGSLSRATESDAVRCTKCELENRAGRKFCASCGAVLQVPCGNCGFPNEVDERYCGGCGHSLGGEKTGAVEAGRKLEPEGERRPVTALFCGLVGYTSLSSALDAEDVHALLERFFALVDATVDRFGGTIDKHIGDAAMALFGAPLARGNDAERAVRAALEIQTSVPRLATGLPSALAVHIGIATGEVIASSVGSQHHRGYTVTGEAANIAARLLEKAVSGEPLVSDDVYQATNHVVSYQPLGPLALKGVGHSVEVWRPTGIRSSAPQNHALVGRPSELRHLRAVLDACVNGATGTAVLIRGEAGIGRTRLMDGLQSSAAASDMSCTAGFVLDFRTERGHGAVRTVVAGLLGLGSAVAPDVAECAIEEILRDGRLQADDALYLRDLLEMSAPETMRKHYE